jgi:hypothetical protein
MSDGGRDIIAQTRPRLSVRQMAQDVGVSDDKVRLWIERGLIRDAINIGDGKNRFYRVTQEAWDEFKRDRGIKKASAPTARFRARAGTNHLGL